jgi:hypothetical protein
VTAIAIRHARAVTIWKLPERRSGGRSRITELLAAVRDEVEFRVSTVNPGTQHSYIIKDSVVSCLAESVVQVDRQTAQSDYVRDGVCNGFNRDGLLISRSALDGGICNAQNDGRPLRQWCAVTGPYECDR